MNASTKSVGQKLAKRPHPGRPPSDPATTLVVKREIRFTTSQDRELEATMALVSAGKKNAVEFGAWGRDVVMREARRVIEVAKKKRR